MGKLQHLPKYPGNTFIQKDTYYILKAMKADMYMMNIFTYIFSVFKNYRVYLNATIPNPKENGLDITKLIVLALVTIFTVVGNFVVILSILLRR